MYQETNIQELQTIRLRSRPYLRVQTEQGSKNNSNIGIKSMKLPKPKLIYVDVDGTICIQENNKDFDDQPIDYSKNEPIPERIKQINELYDKGHTIVYWTARGCRSGIDHTELTRDQLVRWGAKFHGLEVGNKPHFDMYICDKSYNAESWFHRKSWGLP